MRSLPIVIAMLGLTGCFKGDHNLSSSVETGETGKARIVVQTGKVGALAKASGTRDITLSTLEVTLSAPGESDISQSFPLSGNAATTVSHTFADLASLKTWTLAARSIDANGNTIHGGSTTFEVRPRQTADVNLNLSALFSMLKARFFPLRDSVIRCELWVDGVKQDDSAFAKQSALGDTIPLAFDYLGTGGSHTIKMDVYGEMWGFDTLLYTEDTVLNIAAGQDASHRMLLKWVGPALPPPGQASMTVALGSIGTVLLNGQMGVDWSEVTVPGGPTGPILNSYPDINYHQESNRLIVFYASNPSVSYRQGEVSQVWILTHANGLDGSPEWIRLPVGGTLPNNINANASVSYTPGNQLIVYGGCLANCSPAQSSVYVLSNANGLGGAAVWSTVTVSNPQARSGMEGAYDPAANALIMFGGNLAFFGTDHDDTRTLANADGSGGTSSWATLNFTGSHPSPRSETFASVFDASNRRIILFGGNNLRRTCCPYDIGQFNDVWILSNGAGPGTPAWEELQPPGPLPERRSSSAVAYDPAHNRLLVHGGSQWSNETQSYTNLLDLWQLDNANGLGGTPAWTLLKQSGSSPGAMSGHGAAFDAVNQKLIMVGVANPAVEERPKVWILSL